MMEQCTLWNALQDMQLMRNVPREHWAFRFEEYYTQYARHQLFDQKLNCVLYFAFQLSASEKLYEMLWPTSK